MLTLVKDQNFLQELELDWATWLIVNLGTIFKIAKISWPICSCGQEIET